MEEGRLREWLADVEEFGEVKRFHGASAELEIGTLTEITCREMGNRWLLHFDDIPGYPSGYRVISNMLGSVVRLSLAVGFPTNIDQLGVVQQWRELMPKIQPIPPVEVKDGPLFENVFRGGDIDLWKFPSPRWHEKDGGQYIGTACCVITRDPDTGWVNCGTYRVMVYGKDQLALYMAPGRHGRIHMEKYFARGEKCPIAISFGHDPLLFILGGMQVPTDVSEYEYAGGIRKEPLKVTPGPMTGLPLPYDSEIVIEGEVSPDDNGPEGPFGEYTGYYGGAERTEPIIRVNALYHRNDPIICGAAPGRPPMDTTYWEQFQVAARIWTQIEAAGVPDVKGVWCHFPGANFFIVVSITQRYAGHAKQAALLASQCHAGAHMNRYVVVVDDDIDVTNINDVLWAMSTRCDPIRDIEITTDCWSQRLDTAIEPGTNLNSKAIINACRPFHRLATFPAVAEASPEERRRVLEKWRSVLEAPNGVATTAPQPESRLSR